ncbi:MAG: hypothetical protein AB1305_00750 [Candidatus Hadarchaeota archaeon]
MDEIIIMKKMREKVLGVREIISVTGWKPSRVIELLRKLEREGLVEFKRDAPSGRGRPKKTTHLTALGQRYLTKFGESERLRLRTAPSDVKRAVMQARDVERLVKSGRSTYQMLWELDEIVRTVRDSAKAA